MKDFVEGPAGRLEIRTDGAEARTTSVAVLCHPHPQYGGSLHDAVLDAALQALRTREALCLRFNFRGVGASEGSFDGGDGEREDVLAVVRHARDAHGPRPLLLVGYSFGAAMAWKAAREADPQALLLIAPPVGPMAFEASDAPSCPVHVVAGAQDAYAPQEQLQALFDALPQRGALTIVPGADHFFSGELDAVARAVLQAS